MLVSPNQDKTAVHGCHSTGKLAVRMRKVRSGQTAEICSVTIAFRWFIYYTWHHRLLGQQLVVAQCNLFNFYFILLVYHQSDRKCRPLQQLRKFVVKFDPWRLAAYLHVPVLRELNSRSSLLLEIIICELFLLNHTILKTSSNHRLLECVRESAICTFFGRFFLSYRGVGLGGGGLNFETT